MTDDYITLEFTTIEVSKLRELEAENRRLRKRLEAQ
jgi:hypothetical protein